MKSTLTLTFAFLVLCSGTSTAAERQELTGEVIRIIDGDTLELMGEDGKPVSAHLHPPREVLHEPPGGALVYVESRGRRSPRLILVSAPACRWTELRRLLQQPLQQPGAHVGGQWVLVTDLTA
jgi:endonuclease YncB( thermonuclease family)